MTFISPRLSELLIRKCDDDDGDIYNQSKPTLPQEEGACTRLLVKEPIFSIKVGHVCRVGEEPKNPRDLYWGKK